MKEVSVEVSDEAVMRESDPAVSPPPAPDPNHDVHVCPFCGLTRQINDEFDPSAPCPRCTLADTPVTRNATKARIGPWHVRQVRNPWAPGMRFETLLALVKRGQVTKDSIVRGPTSHQLWKRAAEIKGLSREFGICYSCGGTIDKQANLCEQCNRLQEPPVNPDMLVEVRETSEKPAGVALATASPCSAGASRPAEPTSPIEMRSSGSSAHADSPAARTVRADEMARARELTSRPPLPRSQPDPAPARPRPQTSEDALLTPQDLAAAFKLDFAPGSSRRRRGRIIAVLLLLAIGIGAAALLYNRPDYRQQASDTIDAGVNRVKVFLASRERKKGTTRPASSGALPPVTYQKSGISRQAAESAAKVSPAPKPVPKSAVAPPVLAKTAVSVAPRAMSTSEPPAVVPADPTAPAAPIVTPAPPSSSAQNISPATQPTDTPTKKADAEKLPSDPVEKVRVLWRRALDADANQDYLEEVQCYEQIEKLPEDLHPAGLDVRLELARKLLK